MGADRAQLALRQVFLFTDSYVMLKPELYIPQSQDQFDSQGRLTDETQRGRVRAQVEALVAWARQVAPR
jgi:chromate reductase